MDIRVSGELNSIITYAREEALRTGSYGIGPDHLFLGIIRHVDNDAYRILEGLEVDMDQLKNSIGLQNYSGKDPLVAYKFMAYDMFDEMIRGIREDAIYILYRARFGREAKREHVARIVDQIESGSKDDLKNRPVEDEENKDTRTKAEKLEVAIKMPEAEPEGPVTPEQIGEMLAARISSRIVNHSAAMAEIAAQNREAAKSVVKHSSYASAWALSKKRHYDEDEIDDPGDGDND